MESMKLYTWNMNRKITINKSKASSRLCFKMSNRNQLYRMAVIFWWES